MGHSAEEQYESFAVRAERIRMNLLVGFDGSEGGRDALELARVMAGTEGSGVLVVVVHPYEPLPPSFEELEGEAAEQAAPLLEEAGQRLAGTEVRARAFGGGTPAGVITKLAESEDVDLIVLGSPHRGTLGRALLGSVAQSVVHGSPRAVGIAPRGYAREAPHRLERIAVAYDGTPEAKAALDRAADLAHAARAALWVLTVVAPPVALPGAVGYAPANPPDAGRIIEEGVRAAEERAPVEGRRLDGSPAPTLAKACEDGVDLLVVGSRGYGPATRVLLGSVSTKLVNSAPCPVLIVPRP
jgi:nucleotide-binding universal stress UspA family protein